MNSAEQIALPFDQPNTQPYSLARESFGPQTAIMALADQLDYVNPDLFGQDTVHYQAELEQAATRRVWLEQADEAFRARDYSGAISLLKRAFEDIEHAHYYDDFLSDAILDTIDLCRNVACRRSRAVVAEVIKLQPAPSVADTVEAPPIAS